ncbi:MAG: endonuclease III domain-containing protein [Desulfohalobiaceae bacterium]|nr:endonuclease III domain-containing protein [Desulfohalobiaceae bacterium]
MPALADLLNMYNSMLENLGPSHWWPGETPFEVCVGAILTQNTNWDNVEKAIANLARNDLLDPLKLFETDGDRLAELIRPAGYYRIKAGRLLNFLHFLRDETGFHLSALGSYETDDLRRKLLEVKGVGAETADSMVLYAFHKPSFVVDAYTVRIFSRHGLVREDIGYEELRSLFMETLPRDVSVYQEYHALLVRTGKRWCRKKYGLCSDCPLYAYNGAKEARVSGDVS